METRDTWKELWVNEPMLLAAIVRFLNVVWHHAMEHTAVLDPIRKDKSFWELIQLDRHSTIGRFARTADRRRSFCYGHGYAKV
jgi:hypothetical protein